MLVYMLDASRAQHVIIRLTVGGCRTLRAGLAALKAKQAKEKEAREAKKMAQSHEGEFYHGTDRGAP